MEKKKGDGSTLQRRQATVKKLHQSKVYEYIRKIEIDGLPRIRAYAEAIDPKIYELPVGAAHRKLDRVREDYPDYDELKEMVLAEQKDWAMRKSYVVQDQAMTLLVNTLKAANNAINKEDATPQELSAANAVLKTIMPALTSVQNKSTADTKNYTKRAEKFIN